MITTMTEARNIAWQFIRNENKPSWCSPVDILLTANIILLSCDEGYCWASQTTLSAMLGIDRRNIRRPLDRLLEHGWITETSRAGSQQSSLLFPQLHNIPFGVIRKVDIAGDAHKLASHYYETVRALPKILSKNGRWRAAAYPHRGWAQHWCMVMQNWLNDGWTKEQIQTVVNYAFQHVGHTAKRGPQCIKRQFDSLAASAGVTK
jgi:Helix-turn-helix domain